MSSGLLVEGQLRSSQLPLPAPLVPQASGVYLVTPEVAAAWLQFNRPENRRMSQRAVASLVATMLAGEYLLTHQPIAFDALGRLIDGQHRLAAVVQSRVTVQMWVIVGANPDTFGVVDTGLARRPTQFLRVKHSNTIHGALGMIRFAEACRDNDGQVPDSFQFAMDVKPCLDMLSDWPEVHDYAQAADRIFRACRLPPAPLLAVLAQAARGSCPEKLGTFVERLKSGAELASNSPILALRRRGMEHRPGMRAFRDRVAMYGVMVKAWNAHTRDAGISCLKFTFHDVEESELPVQRKGSTGLKERMPEVI
ncbi:hypothetical protein [Streptomyces afghaniensis]|uniref:hypothetical protein n=1 Tax=Streptomyces afghaniensis TaxID=66865 RepID=UPI002784976C|nr:hypothetical protein [Streptomyces afghaniensis]MDQ1013536.1 hypothetical protein [Streptomyces afghaniensis]